MKPGLHICIIISLMLVSCHSQGSEPLHSEPIIQPEKNINEVHNIQTTNEPHTLPPIEKKNKVAYLTFDDGPSTNTEPILVILRRYGIHATFFVNGNLTADGNALYHKINEDGHVIGNHTFSHDYSNIYSSVRRYSQDTERLSKLLEKLTGKRPTLLRFPGGSNNHVGRKYGGRNIMPRIIQEMTKEGYQYVDWNVSSTDAALPLQSKRAIIDAVLSAAKTKQKAIILMHDVSLKTTTVEALPEVIEGLLRQGFYFSTLTKTTFNYHFSNP